jgi:hypothetical protein
MLGFACIATLLLAAIALPPSAGAVVEGSPGKIAFDRTASGTQDVWIRNDLTAPDPGERPLLDPSVSAGSTEANPAWAPAHCRSLACTGTGPSDGLVSQVIAYESDLGGGPDRDIWVAEPVPSATDATHNDPDIVAPTRLTSGPADDSSPSFTDAGVGAGLMAFASNRNGNRDIYVLDLANPQTWANPWRLTSDPAVDGNPDWVDDDHIAFERGRGDEKQIWVLDVVVVRNENPPAPPVQQVFPVVGSERLVTRDQPASFEPSWFRWSRDEEAGPGHEIAFSGDTDRMDHDIHFAEQSGRPDRPFADLANVAMWTLHEDPADDRSPSWSPNGFWLAFSTNRRGSYDIYSMDHGDAAPRPLTSGPADDRNPAVEPRPITATVHVRRICGRACKRRRGGGFTGFGVGAPQGDGPKRSGPRTSKRLACTKRAAKHGDVVRGTPRGDVLCGSRGNDVLIGRGGNDVLRGGSGRDRLFGGGGHDELYGARGDDRLVGGPGQDRMFGEAGADRLNARDRSRDRLRGGPGVDAGAVDRHDRVRDVESLVR